MTVIQTGWRRRQWLGLIGVVYGLSFFLPSAVLHGTFSSGSALSPMTLDGRSCFSWAMQVGGACWYANPVLWGGCLLLTLRKGRLASVAGVTALCLGLSEALPSLLGSLPPAQRAEYLPGYFAWLASMALLTLGGMLYRRTAGRASVPAWPRGADDMFAPGRRPIENGPPDGVTRLGEVVRSSRS